MAQKLLEFIMVASLLTGGALLQTDNKNRLGWFLMGVALAAVVVAIVIGSR